MAFIGEEPRFKKLKPKDTPGPIYNPEKPNHFKSEDETMHSLAPFGSSVDRLKLKEYEERVLNKDFETKQPKKHSKPILEYIRRSASFANQQERFNYDIEKSPGPGKYDSVTFVGEKLLEEEKKRLKVHLHKMKTENHKKFNKEKMDKLQKEIKKEYFKDKSNIEYSDHTANNMMKIPPGRGPNSTFVNGGNVKSLLKDKKGRYVGIDRQRKFNRVREKSC